MRPLAFLFDLDGTLVDTEALWAQAIVDWLADRGQATTVETLAPIVFGHSWIDIHATIHACHPGLEEATAVEDAATLRPYYDRLATDPARLVIPSAVDFFRKAAAVAPCAIVSGSPHADVQAAAALCGIADRVAFVLGGEDYARGKPAPDGFLKAAGMFGVEPAACVVVEDSAAGVAAGRAAGMRVVGVDRNSAYPQDLSGCDWRVRDLSELDPAALVRGCDN